MAKVLLFFTSTYPFGSGETFIENEIQYLAESFDKIIIVSNNCDDIQTGNIPDNCLTVRLPYEINKAQTLLSLLGVFSPEFWKEFRIITKVYKKRVNPVILKTMLVSLQKSRVFSKHIKKLFHTYSSPADSLYCYSYWANDTAFALLKVKRNLPQVKMFCRAHGWDVYFERHESNYLPFRKHLFEKLDKVFFISQNGYNYYKKLFPELEKKMTVSHLGVNKAIDVPTILPAQPFRIYSCSSLIPLKRIHFIIESLAMVDDLEIEWHHYGTGHLEENLKQLAHKKLDNKQNIHYKFLGHIDHKTITTAILKGQYHLLINVSETEGLPVSIMEAMAMGILVIATNVGGTQEIVKDAYNGFLLPPNPAPAEVAESIKKFCFLPEEEKRRMRENAYRTWDEDFNAEKNYEAFTEKILSL